MSRRRKLNTSLMLDPLKIAYSQNSISFKFTNGTLLSTAITKLVRGTLKLSQFPPIRVFHGRNTWFSLDNRRLYVFKEAAKKGVFTQIPVIDTASTELRQCELDAKLTTVNAGRQVTVRGAAARTNATTKCHYCLKECKTAGYLSLHCQEDHIEEYQEESRATFQTIDQFLMSKNFAIKDDLLISLDHLQVDRESTTHKDTDCHNFNREIHELSTLDLRPFDISRCKWRKTIRFPDKTSDKENRPSSRNHVTSRNHVYRRNTDQVYWQKEEITSHDIYATNLFNKILHFKDAKYPLF